MTANTPPRSRADRPERAGGETGGLAVGAGQLAALIVGAARARLHRRAMWRYRRAGYRPYVEHTAEPNRD